VTFRTLRIVCTVAAAVLVGCALAVAVIPLPAPSVGGTCGPGMGSETPAEAFFNPVSIGAGPKPSASSGQLAQWNAFVGQCQRATNTRMGLAGGLVLLAIGIGVVLPPVVKRIDKEGTAASAGPGAPAVGGPPPGWYADPERPGAVRWWDGATWAGPSPGAPYSSALSPSPTAASPSAP